MRFDTHVDGGVQYIRIGDPDRTVTGAHTYVIRYTARGVTNAVDGHTELDWNAVGDRWAVPIMAATVAVTAPAPVTRTACAAGAPGSWAGCLRSTMDGRVATFRHEGLRAGTGLTVVVAVPAGSVAVAPMVVRRHDPAAAWRVTPPAAAGGLGIAAAGMLAALLALRAARRRPPAGPQVEPPDEIRPGEAGTLVDGRADTVDVTATIVDLAVRGHLRIRQLPHAEPEDWELVRLDGARGNLAWYEQTLMRALFDGRQRVRLSELRGGFAEDLARVRRQLDERMVSRGWYRQSPQGARRRIRGIGVALLAAALGATVALGLLVQAAPLGAGAVLACLLLLVLAGRMVAPTGPGRAGPGDAGPGGSVPAAPAGLGAGRRGTVPVPAVRDGVRDGRPLGGPPGRPGERGRPRGGGRRVRPVRVLVHRRRYRLSPLVPGVLHRRRGHRRRHGDHARGGRRRDRIHLRHRNLRYVGGRGLRRRWRGQLVSQRPLWTCPTGHGRPVRAGAVDRAS